MISLVKLIKNTPLIAYRPHDHPPAHPSDLEAEAQLDAGPMLSAPAQSVKDIKISGISVAVCSFLFWPAAVSAVFSWFACMLLSFRVLMPFFMLKDPAVFAVSTCADDVAVLPGLDSQVTALYPLLGLRAGQT